MTMQISGSNGATFPDTTVQNTALPAVATTAEMQVGTQTAARTLSPALVAAAIQSQAASSISPVNLLVFDSSGTFVPTVTGYYEVYVSGGGGSGGSVNNGGTGGPSIGTGGGAGGFAMKKLLLTSGVTYTCTVGSGGAAVTPVVNVIAGNAGGASSFSGTGITTITANGGGGGLAVNSGAITSGGTGGTATGGDFNYQGGNGGSVTAAIGASMVVTGGGAVSIRGTAYRGGNVTANVGASGTVIRTGGGGIGGNGGDISTFAGTTGGGGNNGAATNNATSNPINNALLPLPFNCFFNPNIGTGNSVVAGGGWGAGYNGTTYYGPGDYGGGTTSYAGGNGGGGGSGTSATAATASGAGGNGRIIIMW